MLFNSTEHERMHFARARVLAQLKELAARSEYVANIGIWDGVWDEKHCEFTRMGRPELRLGEGDLYRPENSIIGAADTWDKDQEVLATMLPKVEPCIPPADAYHVRPFVDHATFIAGLLAGQSDETGMEGIYPDAGLWMFDFNASRLNPPWDPIARVQEKGIDLRFQLPFVVNISQGSEAQAVRDVLETIMLNRPPENGGSDDGAWTNQILFVISAADAGHEYAGVDAAAEAGFLPITENPTVRRGTLTVVGLGASGDDVLRCADINNAAMLAATWRVPISLPDVPICGTNPTLFQSDYGPAFDLAAIGIAVGPLSGGRFGILAGASVAAPYVSGLAALMRARLQAEQFRVALQHPLNYRDTIAVPENVVNLVRQRILYTADPLHDTSDGPISKFGRINFERGLDFDFDELTATEGSAAAGGLAACIARPGRVVLAADTPVLKIFSAPNDQISIGAVRRIAREGPQTGRSAPESAYYVVYVDDSGELAIRRDASFAPGIILHFNCLDPLTRMPFEGLTPTANIAMAAVDLDDFSRCSFFVRDCKSVAQPRP